jgi:hypothetical protein
MDDLHRQISELIAAEHRLREGTMDDESLSKLTELETHLDQIWDVLRQRDARRHVGEDPGRAQERPASEVESYLQ